MRTRSFVALLLLVMSAVACREGTTDPLVSLPREVREFLQADSTLGVRTSARIELASPAVALFRVSYGEPLDCLSGCFFASAVVLQIGERVGWVTYLGPAPNANVFQPQPRDTITFTPALLDELRRNDSEAYFAVAFTIACSPNAASSLRERIRRDTPTLAPPSYCPTL
jgi:hypothetical protein